jgi:hypothetical protein
MPPLTKQWSQGPLALPSFLTQHTRLHPINKNIPFLKAVQAANQDTTAQSLISSLKSRNKVALMTLTNNRVVPEAHLKTYIKLTRKHTLTSINKKHIYISLTFFFIMALFVARFLIIANPNSNYTTYISTLVYASHE